MSGYAAISKTGRVAAGEPDTIWYPRDQIANVRGVILCHGMGYEMEFVDPAQQNCSRIAAAIASAGFPCVAGEFGGDILGHDPATADVSAAWSLLQSETGCASDKVILWGTSMGAATAIKWAETYPDKVAALVAAIPATDANDVYTNNRSGLQSYIGSIWGVTYPTPLPAAAIINSADKTALIANKFPVQFYYSTADTLVMPATVTSFVAAVGGTATVCSTTAPHGDSALGSVNTDDIVNILLGVATP